MKTFDIFTTKNRRKRVDEKGERLVLDMMGFPLHLVRLSRDEKKTAMFIHPSICSCRCSSTGQLHSTCPVTTDPHYCYHHLHCSSPSVLPAHHHQSTPPQQTLPRNSITHQAYTDYPYSAHSHSTHIPSYNAIRYPVSALNPLPKPQKTTYQFTAPPTVTHSRFFPLYTHQNEYTLPRVSLSFTPCLVDGPLRHLTVAEPPTMAQLCGREMARMSRGSVSVFVSLNGAVAAVPARARVSRERRFISAVSIANAWAWVGVDVDVEPRCRSVEVGFVLKDGTPNLTTHAGSTTHRRLLCLTRDRGQSRRWGWPDIVRKWYCAPVFG